MIKLQIPTTVFTLFIGLNKDQVTVEFQPRELSVTALIPQRNNSEYNLEIDLAHEIQPERCTFKVLSTKLEIKMLKKDGIRWTVLEGDDPLPLPVAPVNTGNGQSSSGATATKNPYSRYYRTVESYPRD